MAEVFHKFLDSLKASNERMVDYFNSMSTISWLLMASVLWGIYFYLAFYWKKNPVPLNVRELRKKYKSL